MKIVKSMKIMSLVFAAALLAAACGSDNATSAADASGAAAEIPVIDAANISERAGTPLVINFFASWCPSCVSELPDFEEVHQNFGEDVTFLGIAQRDRPSDALSLIERTGVTYEIGNDPDGELFQDYNALAMPTTVFVSADGEVVKTFSGVLTTESLTSIINEELL